MKIGILIDSLDKFGGIGKIAISEVVELSKNDIEVELLVFKSVNVDKYQTNKYNINIIYLENFISSKLRLNKTIPGFTILNLSHFIYPIIYLLNIENKKWDYVICHESYLMPFAVLIKIFKNIKIGYYVWDPIYYIYERVYSINHGKLKKMIFRLIYNQIDKIFLYFSDLVITGGKSHLKYLKQCTSKEISVIYPGIEPKKRYHGNKLMNIFIITAWKRGKNPEYIIEIANKVPMFKFLIGGMWLDDKYQFDFKNFVDEYNIAKNITILGQLSESDLIMNYKQSLVVLQTNDDRGFGMPAYEAASCGTTFIIPKGQGVCDLFTNNVHGFFTDEYDTEFILKILNNLYKNPIEAYKLGNNAYNLIESKFSNKMHAINLLEAINARF